MGDLLRHARGHRYRGDDAGIRAAAADVPVELAGDVGIAGAGILLQQRHASDDHARCAVAALHGVGFDEGLLQRVQTAVLLDPFDCRDLFALRFAERSDAAPYGRAVQKHGTGAALTFAAAVLGSGKVEFIAEYVEEGAFGIALDAMPGAVDDQFHAFIVGQLGKLRFPLPDRPITNRPQVTNLPYTARTSWCAA